MQTDSSSQKIGFRSLSLKLHIYLNRRSLKRVASHLPEVSVDDAFAAVDAFLVGKEFVGPRIRSLIIDFGGLLLWPCINKTNQDQSTKPCSYDIETHAFVVGHIQCRILPAKQKINYPSRRNTVPKLTLVVMRRILKTWDTGFRHELRQRSHDLTSAFGVWRRRLNLFGKVCSFLSMTTRN